MYDVLGRISSIENFNYTYPSCRNCFKKLSSIDNSSYRWTCQQCFQQFREPKYRYRLTLTVIIERGRSMKLAGFGKPVEKLFGADVETFRADAVSCSATRIQKAIKSSLVGQVFSFRFNSSNILSYLNTAKDVCGSTAQQAAEKDFIFDDIQPLSSTFIPVRCMLIDSTEPSRKSFFDKTLSLSSDESWKVGSFLLSERLDSQGNSTHSASLLADTICRPGLILPVGKELSLLLCGHESVFSLGSKSLLGRGKSSDCDTLLSDSSDGETSSSEETLNALPNCDEITVVENFQAVPANGSSFSLTDIQGTDGTVTLEKSNCLGADAPSATLTLDTAQDISKSPLCIGNSNQADGWSTFSFESSSSCLVVGTPSSSREASHGLSTSSRGTLLPSLDEALSERVPGFRESLKKVGRKQPLHNFACSTPLVPLKRSRKVSDKSHTGAGRPKAQPSVLETPGQAARCPKANGVGLERLLPAVLGSSAKSVSNLFEMAMTSPILSFSDNE